MAPLISDNETEHDAEVMEQALIRNSEFSLGLPRKKKGIFRVLRWFFYKLCRHISFPFAVSLVTSMGGFLIAAQILFFILETVDFDITRSGDEFNRLFFLLVLFVYAPGYYVHFGLLYPVKLLRWLSPFGSNLRLLSDYTTGYNIKGKIPEHIQVLVLKAVEKLPLSNTIAAFIYPTIVLIAVAIQEYLIGSVKNAVTLFGAIFSAILVYSFFTYVIAELISGGVRSRIKRTLIIRRIPYTEESTFSIKFKYLFVGIFVLISFIQLWYMMAFSTKHDIIMPLMFIIFTILIIFGIFYLYYASIQMALDEIEGAAHNLSSGGRGKLYSRSLDKEIINLSRGIVAMAYEVNDNRENLERKVDERTMELQEALDQVHALKNQQDGDYYLTSLLCKPLFVNVNKSESTSTDFVIKQKKHFSFRNRTGELGGDICVTGTIRLGTEDNFTNYTVAMNGDAMGKSMQGAGGSLVMGVMMNSILERNSDQLQNIAPDEWLEEVYKEIHAVFKSFNGTMVISCVITAINDETGDMYYFNAEHPYSVIYRDGRAEFIEDGLQLRKLGLDSEIPFKVHHFQLVPGDVVILGSDGRDDLNLTPEEPYKTMNEDDTLFLKYIEESNADLEEILSRIEQSGELTDDLSILRIGFQEETVEQVLHGVNIESSGTRTYNRLEEEVIDLYKDAREFINDGDNERALQTLKEAFDLNQNNSKINKILGLLAFKGKDYETAISVIKKQIEIEPELFDLKYYLSVALKKTGELEEAKTTALQLNEHRPNYVKNLVNIADIYRLSGDNNNAVKFSKKALELDPENEKAKRFLTLINQ